MDILKNIDLLAVGLTVAMIAILGVVVFLNDRKSITNKTFLLFSVSAIFYGVFNYFSYNYINANQETRELFVLWFIRLAVFSATWYSYFLFQFFYVFPDKKVVFTKVHKFILLPVVALVSLSALTPFTFSGIEKLADPGQVSKTVYELGFAFFVGSTFFLVFESLFILIRKTIRAKNREKNQFLLISVGAITTYSLIIIFNLLLPAVFNELRLIPLVAFVTIPFIIFTSYAILKEGLFNVKVIATELLVFALWILILVRALLSTQLQDIVLNGGLLVVLVVVGIFLIRSVFHEVNQREKIEGLMTELNKSNDKLWVANERLHELDKMKTEFVSLATHQLRSPLTAIKGYASMLLEGSFGPVEEKARGAVDVVFQSSQKLVQVIEDFLNITRIELGTMKYEQSEFDFKTVVETVAKELKPSVEKKGLQFSLEIDPAVDYKVVGDSGKLSQVVGNLIDNAIKYTKEGQIKVVLKNPSTLLDFAQSKPLGASKIRLEVSDTGVGIPTEVMPKLFLKFSRAGDAGKTNIAGTGLGLYVAKEIVDAHHGKIWAESEGVGKGSRFIVEI